MENAVVNCVTVKLYRIPGCSLCDRMEKNLKRFKPIVYDCSRHKYKNTVNGVRRLLGNWFGYPLIVIQYEDLALLISGYYSEMVTDIKKTIKELKK